MEGVGREVNSGQSAVYGIKGAICAYCGELISDIKKSHKKFCNIGCKNSYHKTVYAIGLEAMQSGRAADDVENVGNKLYTIFRYLMTGPKTALQIERHVMTVCVSTRISDLRSKGCDIVGRYLGRSKNNSQIWEYELLSWPIELMSKTGWRQSPLERMER